MGLDANDTVAIVALVVSVVALLGTVAQVLQQYYASAAGYSNCDEKVIGDWSKSKRRKFRWYELRFEVLFEAPVIFVAPRGNKKGPVQGADIYYIDGTPRSCRETRVPDPSKEDSSQPRHDIKDQIHTADNERATWVILMSELQKMERQSREWQEKQHDERPPKHGVQRPIPPKVEEHKLAVAMQAKRRSWDTMPTDVKKPYATTTMCHLIELAAMLGVYWKEFNRSKDKYRAEGNGYMLTGGVVPDLGVMFNFQISGKATFEENRVIPADEVKALCFGVVNTFMQPHNDTRRIDTEEPRDWTVLHLGSMNETAETLMSIGCNTNTANIIRDQTKKHGHLFSVAFELIGMMAKTLHIPNSSFRMLPNPTMYHWDKKFFSLRKLMREYLKQLRDLSRETEQISNLRGLADRILTAMHDKDYSQRDFSLELIAALHNGLAACDTYLSGKERRELLYILRVHIQEVLTMLNTEVSTMPSKEVSTMPNTEVSTMPNTGVEEGEDDLKQPPSFDDLHTASPEDKQSCFMEIYFKTVLPHVLTQTRALSRAQTTVYHSQAHHTESPRRRQLSGVSSHSSTRKHSEDAITTAIEVDAPVVDIQAPYAVHGTIEHEAEQPILFRSANEGGKDVPYDPDSSLSPDDMARNIWCTLVFRMLCWLLLHDFHKDDVQISKSELLGSRLPVYIS